MSGGPLDFDELAPGDHLGPYELLSLVGTGGMARVWLGRATDGRLVALKMLLPQLSQHVEFQRMFFDEARVASRVRHPNVCTTYELVDLQGILTLVMEWVGGPSLAEVLRAGAAEGDAGSERSAGLPVEPRLAARIIADACAGLHAAHEVVGDDGVPLGVVHRDVSPQNLLFTADGQVKVSDFGIAKAVGKSHVTLTGQVKGKLAYMSPEQLAGGGVDRRSDVFSTGCVLYELVTGQPPFRGDHDTQLMMAIMLGKFEPPSAVHPGVPAELEAIILRALSHDPDMRFPSADHLRQALEGYLQATGAPITRATVASLLGDRCPSALARAAGLQSLERGTRRDAPNRPETTGQKRLWLAAIFIGATLGALVVAVVHKSRRPHATATGRVSSRSFDDSGGLPSMTGAGAVDAPTILELPDTPPDPRGLVAYRSVRIHVTPRDAVLSVDGVALPRGNTAVPRPDDGGTLTVAIRAEKHQETLVLVDSATPDEVDIVLEPIVRRAAGPHDGGRSKPTRTGASADPVQDQAPPNPYE